MYNPFPKKKSPLSPLAKAVLAAKVLLDLRDDKLDEKQAGLRLREQVRLQWTVLTAAQYLTGREAMLALTSLPADWVDEGRTRGQMVEAILLANDFCANALPSGNSLSAGSLVSALKPGGKVETLLRERLADKTSEDPDQGR